MTEDRIYNSILIDNYIQLIKHKYTSVSVDDILSESGIEPWDLDPGNWFTQEQVNRFQRVIVEKTGNPAIAREAGRFSVAERSGNIMRQAALSLLSPTNLYSIIGKIAQRYSKAASIYSEKITKNKQQVTVEYKPGVKPEKFQCLNYQGYLEAVYSVFYSRLPKIDHEECYFNKGRQCRYIISWDPSIPQRLRSIRLASISVFFLLLVFTPIFKWPSVFCYLSLVLMLILILISQYYEKEELINTVRKQDFKPYDVMDSHSRFYHSTNLINEIAKSLSKNTSIAEVVHNLSHILISLGYLSGLIIFLDYDKVEPVYKKLYLFGTAGNRFIDDLENQKVSFSIIDDGLKRTLVKDLHESIPKEISNVLCRYNICPSANIPIVFEKALQGFILIDKGKGNQLQASDLHILNAISSQAALSITNISFYNSLLESETLKSNFVTVASHELLTPIQIINLACQDISMTVQQSGLDDRNLGESIEILHQAVNKLNSVSTNVLNFNKLENTKLKLSAIDIHKLIDEIKEVSIYANASFNHTITLDIDSNISSILCHRSTFMQLITNLVDNSAKYTPENGLISISFTLRLSELTISVTDNGIGIPKKFHEKIFMKFYQVNDDERGCGLGLSFCQDVAKKHAGYISVESPVFPQEQIRRGSKFIIHLPATMAKLNSKLHESSRHLHKNLHLAIRSPALRK